MGQKQTTEEDWLRFFIWQYIKQNQDQIHNVQMQAPSTVYEFSPSVIILQNRTDSSHIAAAQGLVAQAISV